MKRARESKQMKQRISYTKKRQNFSLFLGLAWLILGIIRLLAETTLQNIDYTWLLLAALSILIYLYEYKNQYLIIENGLLYKGYPLSKKIKLAEVVRIQKIGVDIVLKTRNEVLTINTQVIEKKSLQELIGILEKLELPPDRTPFVHVLQP